MATSSPTVKGTGVRAMVRFVKERGGDAHERVMKRLPPESRQILEAHTILPTSRYPEEVDHHLLVAICDELFSADIDQATQLGKAVMDEGMNIFSRLFLRVGDPAYLISKAGVVWNQYHQVGQLEVFDVTKTSARATLTEYPWLDLPFCRVLTGTFIRALELSGCNDIRIEHEQCVGTYAPHCRYNVTWGGVA